MTDSVIITNREATYVVENIGEVGPQGETGATGAPGPQGIQGIQGERGSDGIQGPQGETGAAGTSVKIMGTVNTVLDLPSSANPGEGYVVTEDGDVYFYAVLTGWTSAGQIVGPAGPTGPQGPRGDQGIQGIQGEQGIQGVQGSAGTSIEIMGEVATVENLPETAATGEGYIVTADGDLYFYTPESGWLSAGQIVGPQGPQGIQGEQGPQGIQGIPGVDAPVDTYLPLTGGTLTGNLTISKAAPSVILNNSSGKEAALLTGTTGAAFVYDSTGSFYILRNTSAAISAGTGGSGGTSILEATSAGNINLTGDLTISKSEPILTLSGNVETKRSIHFQTSGVDRWRIIAANNPESGSNVGSDFRLDSYTDAGGYMGSPLTIIRQTGWAYFGGNVNIAGATTLSGNLTISKATATQTLSASSGDVTSNIDRVAGQSGLLRFRTGASSRWVLRTDNTAESSTAYGSDFRIDSYNNSGVYIESPIAISRSSGVVTLGNASTAGLALGYSGPRMMSGTGSPEGVVTAPVSSTWHRTDGGAGTSFYVKESGTGNTGWVAK